MSISVILIIGAVLLCGLMLGWGLFIFMESQRFSRAEKLPFEKTWCSRLAQSRDKICGVPARKEFFSSTMFKNGKRVEYTQKRGKK